MKVMIYDHMIENVMIYNIIQIQLSSTQNDWKKKIY